MIFNKNVEAMQVEKLLELFSKQKAGMVNLSIGSPNFDVPDEVKQAAIKAINEGHNGYIGALGLPLLREKIKQKLLRDNKINVNTDQIMITNAVSSGMSIILTTITNPGDEVILMDPYFLSYPEWILGDGGIPVIVDTKNDYSLDLEKIKLAINEKTKAIVINSPNNPSGKVYSQDELERLVEIAKEKNILIISDEIYEQFIYEGKHFSVGSIYDNTITLNGFSKSHAMTGWRIGYLCGPKEIIDQALKIQQYNYVCAPVPFQHAAITAIDCDVSHQIKEYKEKSEIVYNGLKNHYDLIKPEGAFYAFIKIPYDGFVEKCFENNLFVVSGDLFSKNKDCFRISFSCDKEMLKKGIEILQRLAKP